jgi:hypothetical protein
MAFTQPVVHEFERIRNPTTLMIGQLDRTALAANRAPPDVAKKLGNYPELGGEAARRIPNAGLIEFPQLGHVTRLETWHWMSFLAHVASTVHSSSTSTNRRKQEL